MEIILFVAACLVWQAIKNAVRGPRKPVVRLGGDLTVRVGSVHAVAACGCDTMDNKVVKACAAHRLMLGL